MAEGPNHVFGYGAGTNEAWRTPAQVDEYRWQQTVRHWEAEAEIFNLILTKLDEIGAKIDSLSTGSRRTRQKVAPESKE